MERKLYSIYNATQYTSMELGDFFAVKNLINTADKEINEIELILNLHEIIQTEDLGRYCFVPGDCTKIQEPNIYCITDFYLVDKNTLEIAGKIDVASTNTVPNDLLILCDEEYAKSHGWLDSNNSAVDEEPKHENPQDKDSVAIMEELQENVNIGMGALQRGSNGLALMIFTKALNLALNSDGVSDTAIRKIYYLRGLGYVENGEHDCAIEDFSQVILRNPQDIDAYLQRAVCYANIGDKEKTLLDLNTASKIDPNHEAVIRYLKVFDGQN
ncbi:MAG: hypothetical protein FWH17_05050 [Oscillospiraceae bacterium]|nr:hypothetical protein [Oscillospiraceae bacterium]